MTIFNNSKELFTTPILFLTRISEILVANNKVVNELLELKDGRIFERQFIPIVINGENKGRLWTYKDTTKQKKYEHALTASEKRADLQSKVIRNLLETLNDAVIRCDFNSLISVHNPAFLKMFDLGEIETIGKIKFFDLLPNEQLTKIKNELQILFNTHISQSGFMFCKNKHISYTLALPLDHNFNAFTCIMTDITEITNKEKNLNHIIEKQKELNAEKSRFIRITSHELRTPLSIIQSNAEILEMIRKGELKEKEKVQPAKLLSRIIKEVGQITEILNQLLTVSRVESGKLEYKPEAMEIVPFLKSLIEDLYNPYTDGRVLQFEYQENLTTVFADKYLLRHALVNLINNAFKFSANRWQPKLKIKRGNNNIEFEVIDFGLGIPEDESKSIFNSFFRASNVGNVPGTGLGLMIVDYAVKKHNGTVTFTSELNSGTNFKISIPQTNEQ